MCLPCDVLNYLVSTELKTTTGCLLCVLPVSRTLVRLKHICIFHLKNGTLADGIVDKHIRILYELNYLLRFGTGPKKQTGTRKHLTNASCPL